MPRLTFAFSPDGLLVPALVGLDALAMQNRLARGEPLTRPIHVRAQIDSGSLVTGVGPATLTALGAIAVGSSRTQTASGLATVQLYLISFTVFDPTGANKAALYRTSWPVTSLPVDLPDVEVLFGMDLIPEVVFQIDGPGGQFIIDF
jgi:hypothetical protein